MKINPRDEFEALFNYSSDCILIVDRSGKIKRTNEKSLIFFGEELKNKNLYHIDPSFEENIEYVSTTGLVQTVHKKIMSEGQLYPFHFTFVPLFSGNKVAEVILIIKNVRDIELLREEVERLKRKVSKLAGENKVFRNLGNGKDKSEELKLALKNLEIANERLEAINKNLTKELELASILQKSLIPDKAPEDKRLKFIFRFEPMGHVGGDYFEIIQLRKDDYGVMVADVSGHGVSSAFIAAMFKISFMNYGTELVLPAKVLKKLNNDYCSVIKTGDYVTAFYTVFDLNRRKLRFSGAGHPMPILYHKDKDKAEFLPSEGFFIGMFENAEYKDSERSFGVGDRYLAYTDGIIEAYSEEASEQFGEKRLMESFKRHKEKPLEVMVDSIISDVKMFMKKSKFYDDLTIVAVEFVSD